MTLFIATGAGQSWMWSTPTGFLPAAVVLDHEQRRDLIFVEQRQRVVDQVVRARSSWDRGS